MVDLVKRYDELVDFVLCKCLLSLLLFLLLLLLLLLLLVNKRQTLMSPDGSPLKNPLPCLELFY